ncbi:hypothetical protein L596_021922 [Steinernema carpocapsae]|uniref:Uncharacterized protein n=1 Tax=Steinernema carpocapsae TaxID=34508 RepID=A0A4U5MK81_STECR|nr:hypothetical protein L596_021922 [Steinernema carpocapsae]
MLKCEWAKNATSAARRVIPKIPKPGFFNALLHYFRWRHVCNNPLVRVIRPVAHVYAKLNGRFLKKLIDTGSMISFCLVKRVLHRVQLKKCRKEAYTANGSVFRFESKFEGKVVLGNVVITVAERPREQT